MEGDEKGISPGVGGQAILGGGTPSRVAYRGEKGVIIDSILEQLSDRHALVLRLRHLRGLAFAEIGEVMGISEDASKALYGRAAVRFRIVGGNAPGVADFTEVVGPEDEAP